MTTPDEDTVAVATAFSRIYVHCKLAARRDPATGETVSHQQAAVLDALCDVHPKYVGDVARRLGVTAATLSLTLDRMERDGLVIRAADAVDRRRIQVLLTERGNRLQRAAQVVDDARLDALIARLDASTRAQLIESLAALAEATRQEEDEAPT